LDVGSFHHHGRAGGSARGELGGSAVAARPSSARRVVPVMPAAADAFAGPCPSDDCSAAARPPFVPSLKFPNGPALAWVAAHKCDDERTSTSPTSSESPTSVQSPHASQQSADGIQSAHARSLSPHGHASLSSQYSSHALLSPHASHSPSGRILRLEDITIIKRR
jgi:hypothetical protein